jgi:crotonobetainyl-CoA:carnitine CoA-transferase CaiB-like acyl-CoA transferase
MAALPLDGVTVADFGQGVAGPYAGMLLADHGATVIKIEPPRGDWGRSLGERDFGGHSAVSVAMNRNKQSITLDLAQDEGREVALQLIARSQVVLENFRPDVMDRMGLGYQTVSAGRGDLVYCSVNGFGPTGPYASLPSGDSITQPLAGLMSIIGGPDDPPMRVGNVVSDMLAGMNASQGVLLGLMQSRRTGESQRVNVTLLESMIAFQAPTFTEYLMTGEVPRRSGNDHPMIAPSGAFQTRDGWVYFTVIEHMWRRFCDGVGLPGLPADARFADNALRMQNRRVLNEQIAPTLRGLSTEACIALLRKVDVPCSRINNYAEVLADPQVRHRGVFRRVDHALLDKLPVVTSPVVLEGEIVPYQHPPVNGEHTRQILERVLSYPSERVERLLQSGAAREATTRQPATAP